MFRDTSMRILAELIYGSTLCDEAIKVFCILANMSRWAGGLVGWWNGVCYWRTGGLMNWRVLLADWRIGVADVCMLCCAALCCCAVVLCCAVLCKSVPMPRHARTSDIGVGMISILALILIASTGIYSALPVYHTLSTLSACYAYYVRATPTYCTYPVYSTNPTHPIDPAHPTNPAHPSFYQSRK